MRSSIHADPEPRSRPRSDPQPPAPEVDLSAYVLAAVDEQLASLQAVRQQLTMSRAIEPGARWNAAVLSIAAARRYADDMARALSLGAR